MVSHGANLPFTNNGSHLIRICPMRTFTSMFERGYEVGVSGLAQVNVRRKVKSLVRRTNGSGRVHVVFHGLYRSEHPVYGFLPQGSGEEGARLVRPNVRAGIPIIERGGYRLGDFAFERVSSSVLHIHAQPKDGGYCIFRIFSFFYTRRGGGYTIFHVFDSLGLFYGVGGSFLYATGLGDVFMFVGLG